MILRILRRVVIALGAALLLGVTVFVIVRWQSLPAELPSHYDAAGNIDATSGKSGLWMLLILSWVLYGVMNLASLLPASAWNPPPKTPLALHAMRLVLSVMALFMTLCFCYLVLCTALCVPLGAWFLPVMLTLTFLPVAALVVISVKIT